MKKHFIAAVYAEGVHGGIITLTDESFCFTAHKIMTVPQRYVKVMIPYNEIESVLFKPITYMGAVYMAAEILLQNGKAHHFLVSGKKRFLKYMNRMCQGK